MEGNTVAPDELDGSVAPNRAMRRARNPLHGKRRIVTSVDPLRYIDLALTKRRPWTVKAERRAADRRARTARRANR